MSNLLKRILYLNFKVREQQFPIRTKIYRRLIRGFDKENWFIHFKKRKKKRNKTKQILMTQPGAEYINEIIKRFLEPTTFLFFNKIRLYLSFVMIKHAKVFNRWTIIKVDIRFVWCRCDFTVCFGIKNQNWPESIRLKKKNDLVISKGGTAND